MLLRDFEYDFDTKQVTCDVGYLCANCGLPIIGLSVLDLGPM